MHDTAPYGVYGDASIRIGGPTAATSASFQSLRHSIMSSYHQIPISRGGPSPIDTRSCPGFDRCDYRVLYLFA